MSTKSKEPGSPDGELLHELLQRQGLLVGINVVAASLFASGIASAAPASLTAGWLGYMGISQAIRLFCWRRSVRKKTQGNPATWLVATTCAGGIGWGLIGVLFAGLGSPAQQMLVPSFLPG